MKYVRLGDSGLKVSEVCLGTWHLPRLSETDSFGVTKVDVEETRRVVELAFDHGINFIDTANRYHGAQGPVDSNHWGNAENILSGILAGHDRESFAIVSKVGNPMGTWPTSGGLSRKHIFWQIGESLKRLKLNYLDAYLAHHPDEDTPHLETLRAFNDLIRMGKVHYIGCSNFTADQLKNCMELSSAHDLHGFVTIQDAYSLMNRSIELDKVPLARKHNLSVMAYSPLAEGLLSGKYIHSIPTGSRATYSRGLKRVLSERKLNPVQELSTLAKEKGVSLPQLAIAWLLHKQKDLGVSVIPILGVSSREQLLDNLQALDVQLTNEDMSRVEEITSSIQLTEISG